MHSREFLRRYERMPQLKKAELIKGIVYVGSSVSTNHAIPDGIIHGGGWPATPPKSWRH